MLKWAFIQWHLYEITVETNNLSHDLISLQLKRKTVELTKACQKHYELEQELAFYKIDHKFDELAKPPVPISDDNMVHVFI